MTTGTKIDKAAFDAASKTVIDLISQTEKFEAHRLLIEKMRKYETQTAFILPDENTTIISYQSFIQDIQTCAAYFQSRGTANRIAILGRNSYFWIVSCLAVIASGNIAVPLDSALSDTDLTALIRQFNCCMVVRTDKNHPLPECSCPLIGKEEIDAELSRIKQPYHYPDLPADSIACITATSGTTGDIKGVEISHKAICANIWSAESFGRIGNRTILALPLHHTYSFITILIDALIFGVEITVTSDVTRLPSLIKEHHPQYLYVVPAVITALRKGIIAKIRERGKYPAFRLAYTLSSAVGEHSPALRRKLFHEIHEEFGGELNRIISGGADLPAEDELFLERIGLPVINGYGLTETLGGMCINRMENRRFGSVGYPCPAAEIQCSDEGEILIRTPFIMQSYLDNEKATAEAFKDGWYCTGDLGYVDDDGFVFVTGRKKNLIILSNGKNVSGEELERKINAASGVEECCVYQENQTIVAEIFPNSEYLLRHRITDSEAYFTRQIQLINQSNPTYKAIQSVRLRSVAFEKTTTRKIRRPGVKKMVEPKNETEQLVIDVWKRVLGVGRISAADNFFAIGGDSLGAAIVAADLAKDFPRIMPADIFAHPTVEALSVFCLQTKQEEQSDGRLTTVNELIRNLPVRTFPKPESVLLTGAGGYLGAHLFYELQKRQVRTVCLVRSPERFQKNLAFYFGDLSGFNYSLVTGDITEPQFGLAADEYETLRSEVQAVIHAAASVKHVAPWEESHRINVVGTENVAAFCMEGKLPLYACSTMAVNGFCGHEEVSEQMLDVGQTISGNVYVRSKYLAEERLLALSAEGLDVSIFRIGNLVWRRRDGRFQVNESENGYLARMKGMQTVKCYSAEFADMPMDFTYVDECADAFVRLMLADGTGHVWHLMNPNVMTVKQLGSRTLMPEVSAEKFEETLSRCAGRREVRILQMYLSMVRQGFSMGGNTEVTVQELERLGFTWSPMSRMEMFAAMKRLR